MRKLYHFALNLMVAALIAAVPLPVLAADKDMQIPGDTRIKLLMYDETDVYTITTRYGYQTNIVFAPNEEIETISVGDRSVWQIIPAGNRIFIRPMDEDITTNMTVLTNKHSYQFDLKAIAADKAGGNIYVAKFVYNDEKKKPAEIAPPPPIAALQEPSGKQAYVTVPSPFGYAPSVPDASQKPLPQAAVAEAATPGAPNYNYTYSGSDSLAPSQVYDDGQSTYLKYRAIPQPAPSVSVISAGGGETPVASSVKDDYIVVPAVAGELVVRNQDNAVHVFNENINPQ